MDIPLLIIIVLLFVTVTAFVLDIFPYPFGFIVLTAFLFARLLSLKQ